MATVKAAENFDKEADVIKLRDAMKGLGTDEQALIDVLCNRSVDQRVELITEYKTVFGRDLRHDVKDETSKNFGEVLISLIASTPDFLARVCKKAISGVGTSEGALINVLAGCSNTELKAVKESYKKLYKKDLTKDIEGDTSGDLKHLFVGMSQANRDEGNEANHEQAVKDAQDLVNAGIAKMGTDESEFQRILATRNPKHLKRVFAEYKNVAGGEDLETSIKSEMSGDLKKAYMAIVRSIKDTELYFAEQLYESMKGLGTNDDKLIRLVVWRSEIDLEEVKKCFLIVSGGKSLEDFISGDCTGDYKKALLALC